MKRQLLATDISDILMYILITLICYKVGFINMQLIPILNATAHSKRRHNVLFVNKMKGIVHMSQVNWGELVYNPSSLNNKAL